MNFNFSHQLPLEDARQRVQALSEYLSNRYGVSIHWNGNRASISGKYLVVRIDGTLIVSKDKIACEGQDPGLLWRKKATQYVQKKLGQYLDPNVPLEELPRQ